eukprot:451484-Prymnesium_polylepis.2
MDRFHGAAGGDQNFGDVGPKHDDVKLGTILLFEIIEHLPHHGKRLPVLAMVIEHLPQTIAALTTKISSIRLGSLTRLLALSSINAPQSAGCRLSPPPPASMKSWPR